MYRLGGRIVGGDGFEGGKREEDEERWIEQGIIDLFLDALT